MGPIPRLDAVSSIELNPSMPRRTRGLVIYQDIFGLKWRKASVWVQTNDLSVSYMRNLIL